MAAMHAPRVSPIFSGRGLYFPPRDTKIVAHGTGRGIQAEGMRGHLRYAVSGLIFTNARNV
jgi:hypothetical protein